MQHKKSVHQSKRKLTHRKKKLLSCKILLLDLVLTSILGATVIDTCAAIGLGWLPAPTQPLSHSPSSEGQQGEKLG